jgi:glycosyltransferase involved in cell wall biosynthesis
MHTITAVIPAYNEEKNIERCIKSVLWCNKILLLSMGYDKTEDLARKYKIVEIKKFETKKPNFELVQTAINWAIDQCKTDWILRIDADEEVTAGLEQEIKQILTKEKDVVAYGIPRNQYFIDGFLHHGDWAYDRLTRLFKPAFCRYDPIVPVHEQFKVKGKIGYTKNKLNHYSHPDLNTAVEKFQLYTSMEAKELKIPKSAAFIKMIYRPPYVFLRWYLYHFGFLDGQRGLIAGLMRGWYEWLVYSKYLNL